MTIQRFLGQIVTLLNHELVVRIVNDTCVDPSFQRTKNELCSSNECTYEKVQSIVRSETKTTQHVSRHLLVPIHP